MSIIEFKVEHVEKLPAPITVEEFLEQNPGILDRIKFMTPEEVQEKVTRAIWPDAILYSSSEFVRFVKEYIPEPFTGENIPAYNRLWQSIGLDVYDDGTYIRGIGIPKRRSSEE